MLEMLDVRRMMAAVAMCEVGAEGARGRAASRDAVE